MLKQVECKIIAALMVAVFLLAIPALAFAKSEINQSFIGSVAIKGTDPVAYFTEKRAQKGSPKFTHRWKGGEWRFKNATNRDAFAADPEKYAPNSAAIAPGP